jgi:NCS1 family nucleobase:cation symporter-1
VVGGVLAVGGSHSAPGKGPFPEDGLIPVLKPLSDYGWAVGLGSAFVVHLLLMSGAAVKEARRREGERKMRSAAQ